MNQLVYYIFGPIYFTLFFCNIDVMNRYMKIVYYIGVGIYYIHHIYKASQDHPISYPSSILLCPYSITIFSNSPPNDFTSFSTSFQINIIFFIH